MFVQYAAQLSRLAEVNFDSAAAVAALIQRPETRIFARLTMAQGILAGQKAVAAQFNFGGGGLSRGLVILD